MRHPSPRWTAASTSSRYRQRVEFTPVRGLPVWVDAADFDVAEHVKHTRLPAPGDEAQLKRLAGRVLERPLDRSRPLWETWLVEGLAGGRFAIIAKIHHSMVDGASGVNLMTSLYGLEPDDEIAPPVPWKPRPAPSAGELYMREELHRVARPFERLRGGIAALRDLPGTLDTLSSDGRAIASALSDGVRVAPETPINRPIGKHRRVDWHSIELDRVRDLRRRLGGTVNDVLLALVAGTMRRLMGARGVSLDGLDFRVTIPVNVRAPGDDFSEANKVSALLLSLPLAEPDPLRRAHAIRAETERLKASGASFGTELLVNLVDWGGAPRIGRTVAGLLGRLRPYNLIVTNVAGPQVPLYLLDAQVEAMIPQVPLFDGQGLGWAILSYDGQVQTGLMADWDLVPDLARVGGWIDESLEELRAALDAAGS
jgi:WS/DGAT/MGAT family acyltransferase